MTDYKPGDRVTLERTPTGESMVNFEVRDAGDGRLIVWSQWQGIEHDLNDLRNGWHVTSHRTKREADE